MSDQDPDAWLSDGDAAMLAPLKAAINTDENLLAMKQAAKQLSCPQTHAERRALAEQTLETHGRLCVPEAVCGDCLKLWPCPDVQWARRVLNR